MVSPRIGADNMKERQGSVVAPRGVSPRDGEGRAVFALRDEGYRSVCVAGDFNFWSPAADPMAKRRDGSWRLEKRGLLAGTIRRGSSRRSWWRVVTRWIWRG